MPDKNSDKILQNQKRERELIELKRIKQKIDENPYESSEYVKPKESKPETFEQKASNFWYHKKALVLFGGLFTIAFIICIVNFLNAPNPDFYVFLASERPYGPISDKIEKAFSDYSAINGNKYEILLNSAVIQKKGVNVPLEVKGANVTKLIGSFDPSVDDTLLYLLDDCVYEQYEESLFTSFADLSELFPESGLVGKRFFIKDTMFFKETGIIEHFKDTDFPENLSISIKILPENASAKFVKNYERSLILIKNIIDIE